jgi:competence protein ComEC
VLQIDIAGHRLLLPGDIEDEQERTLLRYWREGLRSDWQLVAHHGSQTSSSHAWLKVVRPAVAVVSSGYGNRFGHPHPEVVRRFLERGTQLLSTSQGGALEFRFCAGKAVTVSTYRYEKHRYWL